MKKLLTLVLIIISLISCNNYKDEEKLKDLNLKVVFENNSVDTLFFKAYGYEITEGDYLYDANLKVKFLLKKPSAIVATKVVYVKEIKSTLNDKKN